MTTWEDKVGIDWVLDRITINRVGRRKGFKVLGAIVTADNVSTSALEFSIQRAWAVFNRHRNILCCKNANLKRRLTLLNRVVVSVLRYCAGSCYLTKMHFGNIRRVQNTRIKKILGMGSRG